jgi:hypothetical protein
MKPAYWLILAVLLSPLIFPVLLFLVLFMTVLGLEILRHLEGLLL